MGMCVGVRTNVMASVGVHTYAVAYVGVRTLPLASIGLHRTHLYEHIERGHHVLANTEKQRLIGLRQLVEAEMSARGSVVPAPTACMRTNSNR